MLKKYAVTFALILFLGSFMLSMVQQAKAGDELKEYTGKLVCLGCSLKESEGANAACTKYGHNHVLKTKDGKYIGFLENKYSEDLIKGGTYTNKIVTVTGKYYADANMLDVTSFEVDGKKRAWCDTCKAMDGCKYSKHGTMKK